MMVVQNRCKGIRKCFVRSPALTNKFSRGTRLSLEVHFAPALPETSTKPPTSGPTLRLRFENLKKKISISVNFHKWETEPNLRFFMQQMGQKIGFLLRYITKLSQHVPIFQKRTEVTMQPFFPVCL